MPASLHVEWGHNDEDVDVLIPFRDFFRSKWALFGLLDIYIFLITDGQLYIFLRTDGQLDAAGGTAGRFERGRFVANVDIMRNTSRSVCECNHQTR